jgi:hypothetical protein
MRELLDEIDRGIFVRRLLLIFVEGMGEERCDCANLGCAIGSAQRAIANSHREHANAKRELGISIEKVGESFRIA